MFDSVKHAVMTALPVALLFFTGWAFLSAYLGLFGIDITEVDLSLQTILIFSFRPLNTWGAVAAGIALAALLLIALVYRRFLSIPYDGVTALVLSIFALIFGFKTLGELAESSANAASEQVWTGARVPVEARLSPEEEARGDLIVVDYLSCRSRRGLVHVFSTASKSYLLCRVNRDPASSGMLYVIDNTGLVLSRRKIRRET